jgi:hypothetical protein
MMVRSEMKGKRGQERIDEMLSAYLDDELSSRDRARLETRLAVDASLRDRLTALQRTVALVRELPRVQAPRNFLLTPSMVGQTRRRPARRRWLAPALTFATAVSGLLSAVVLAGGLLANRAGDLELAAPVVVSEEPAYLELAEVTEAPEEAPLPAAAEAPLAPGERAPEPTDEGGLAVRQGVSVTVVTEQEVVVSGTLPPTATVMADAVPPSPEDVFGGGGVPPTATHAATATVGAVELVVVTPTASTPADDAVAEEGALNTAESPTPAALAESEPEGTPASLPLPVPAPEARDGRPTFLGGLWPLAGALIVLTAGLAAASVAAWRGRR